RITRAAPASMEPPRERGGNALESWAPALVMAPLQWSRRVNAAETPDGVIPASSTRAWLQWSRRVNAAETARGRGWLAWRRAASMEPPRERGGNPGPTAHRDPGTGTGFNGAAA